MNSKIIQSLSKHFLHDESQEKERLCPASSMFTDRNVEDALPSHNAIVLYTGKYINLTG